MPNLISFYFPKFLFSRYKVEYTSGGCALNSRVFSWVLSEPGHVLFVGGIEQDQQANTLRNIVNESGVKTK